MRRAIAAGLVGVAAVSAVTGGASDDRTRTVVAARDLRPGQTLTVDDVTVVERDASQLPSGALTDPAEALGHTLAGPVPAGEVLVGVRMLGPRLAAATTGDSAARVVPVRLADPGVGDLLREGDLVDVLTVAEASAPSAPEVRVLATGATVVLAQGTDETNNRGEKVVLLALPPEPATAVAAASLVSALTVTLH